MRRSRSSKQKKDLSVFEFRAEDLAIEEKSAKYRARTPKSSPKVEKDGSLKYMLFRAYSPERNLATTEEMSEINENMTSSTSYVEHNNARLCEFDHETLVRDDPLITGASDLVLPLDGNEQFPDLQSDGIQLDVISDDKENCMSGAISPTSSASEDEDYMEHPLSESCFTAVGEKDKDDLAVTVSPDYVIYENILYGEAELLFFSDSILVKCSDASGNDGNVDLKWTIADTIHIECQWSGSVGAALVKFHVRTTSVNRNGKNHDTCDAVELIFSVTDMHWLEKELKIKCLAGRYKDIWNVPNYARTALEDDPVEHNMFFPGHYFTEIPDSFEDVIYPKGDPDAVSISRRDIELLQPDTFLNDTIVDFYIKYLKTKIPSNERHRFHFFNSFFFRKLADLDKNLGSGLEGKAAFLRVRKWTCKVNIFEKDYIFIPVNFNLHWSLLVICHLGEVANSKEDGIKDSPKVPCILHMDSIKGSHSGLKNLVQSYLLEEWKERHPDVADDHTSKFLNFRFVPLELPQQENSFDCGLFLLHYVELFLEEAPINFSPFKISKFSHFLTEDWFIPSEASFKRSLIRKLIYDLLNDPSQSVASTICCNGQLSSRYPDKDILQKPAVEFLNQQVGPSKDVLDNSTCSITVRGIEMNLETASSGISDCNKQDLVMHVFLEPGTNSLSLSQDDRPFQVPKCATCTREVFADTSEQINNTCVLDKDDCCPFGERSTTQTCSTSYGHKDVRELKALLSSIPEKEEVDLALLPKACNNHDSSNESGEMGKVGPVSEEVDCDHIPDGPSSSSSENQEGVSNDPQEIDVNGCKNSEVNRVGTKTEVAQNLTFVQINSAEAKDVDDDDDIQKSETSEDGKQKISNEINTRKAEIVTGEDHLVVDNINSIDCEKDEDCPQNGSLTLDDLKDTVIIVDENVSVKDGPRLKRVETGTKMELFSQKRRKVMQLDGDRRRTRSISRDCPPTRARLSRM